MTYLAYFHINVNKQTILWKIGEYVVIEQENEIVYGKVTECKIVNGKTVYVLGEIIKKLKNIMFY